MRFQELILSLSKLPTGRSFQDHMNSITTGCDGSITYLSMDISESLSASIKSPTSLDMNISLDTDVENDLESRNNTNLSLQ